QPSALRGARVFVPLIWAVSAGVLALLPQAVYLLNYPEARVDTGSLGDWRLANFWSTTVHTADGTATFAHPMAVFYLLEPLWNVNVGFLSPFYLPALVLSFVVLIQRRAWPLLGLLATWWLLWAGFLSGIPYQTHRFVLGFLPAVAV